LTAARRLPAASIGAGPSLGLEPVVLAIGAGDERSSIGPLATAGPRNTAGVTGDTSRDLEDDLRALADRVRDDDAFADELYCALCNADWVHDDGAEWTGSWRYAAGVVAKLRGRGEGYLDFYCSRSGAEGTISERVGAAMAVLGWRGIGHGAPLRLIDFRTGESKVLVDGDWIDASEHEG
jgi:hypothetical protein